MSEKPCNHKWIANAGRGGAPEFSIKAMQDHRRHIMPAECAKCRDRKWFSKEEWEKLESAE